MAHVRLELLTANDPPLATSCGGGNRAYDGKQPEFHQLECGSPLVVRAILCPSPPHSRLAAFLTRR